MISSICLIREMMGKLLTDWIHIGHINLFTICVFWSLFSFHFCLFFFFFFYLTFLSLVNCFVFVSLWNKDSHSVVTVWKVSLFGVILVRVFPVYLISLRIQSECGKMRTRITPNTDTFYALCIFFLFFFLLKMFLKNTHAFSFMYRQLIIWNSEQKKRK